MRNKTVTIKYCCDFCGKEIDAENEKSNIGVPVPCIRSVETTEGKYPLKKPYIETVNLDLCEEHFNKLVHCEVYGAQGYDTVRNIDANEDTGKCKRFRTECGFPEEDANTGA